MTIISRCSKGGMIQEFQGGNRMYTVSVGLTDTEHHETLEALKANLCHVVCDDVKRKQCVILDNL